MALYLAYPQNHIVLSWPVVGILVPLCLNKILYFAILEGPRAPVFSLYNSWFNLWAILINTYLRRNLDTIISW